MKECPYCGKKYPDDATICVIDETPLEEPQTRKPTAPLIERLWTPYLILCSAFSGFNALWWLAKWQHMNYMWPAFELTMFRLVVFLNPWALVAIWWKNRWGVVAFVALGIIGDGVTLARYGVDAAFQDIIEYIVFIIMARPQWRKMTWDFQTPENKVGDAKSPQEPKAE